MRLGAEEVGHERDYKGLRDRLIEADRQRRVLVSERGQEGGRRRLERCATGSRLSVSAVAPPISRVEGIAATRRFTQRGPPLGIQDRRAT